MKNILLIGANGFIGKNIIEEFLPYNYNLIILNRKTDELNGILTDNRLRIVEGELKDLIILKKIVIDQKVDTVIHLASSLIPSSNIDDYYRELQEVIMPTYAFLDFICESEVKFVFFSSGGTIYGKSNTPLKEDHIPEPINYYGYSKLLCEQYILFKNRTRALNYLILRPSNAFGRYQPLRTDQGFISTAINRILCNDVIEIWGDGSAVRDFIEVQSLTKVLHELLLLNIKNEIINIGSGKGYNLLEVLKIIEKVLQKSTNIKFSNKRNVDLDTMILDITKLRSIVNFVPGSLEESILSYIESAFKK